MNIVDYQRQARALARYPNLGNNLSYPALGLGGEVGELMEAYQRFATGSPSVANRTRMIKEMGDVLWYVVNLAAEMDIPLEGDFITLQHNVQFDGEPIDSDLRWLVARAGRAQEVAKKVFRDKGGIPDDKDRENAGGFLRGVLRYLCRICYRLGFILDCVAQANLDKLHGREERGTLQGDGDDR